MTSVSEESLAAIFDLGSEDVVYDASWPEPSSISRKINGLVDRVFRRSDHAEAKPLPLETVMKPYPDQRFDLVLASAIANQHSEQRAHIMGIKRVLKSGGRLFLAFPTCESPVPSDAQIQNIGTWRQALEAERIWLDLETMVTRSETSFEYIEDSSGRDERKRAIPDAHWYLSLSGIK